MLECLVPQPLSITGFPITPLYSQSEPLVSVTDNYRTGAVPNGEDPSTCQIGSRRTILPRLRLESSLRTRLFKSSRPAKKVSKQRGFVLERVDKRCTRRSQVPSRTNGCRSSFYDLLDRAEKVRSKNVIIIPHGSLVEYWADNFIALEVPLLKSSDLEMGRQS